MFAILPDLLEPLWSTQPCVLGPGTPDMAMKSLLAAFDPHTVATKALQVRALYSALWLAHNFLDESHDISQELHTPTGSLLHAIMHRREPDAWNSKYWWKRVGAHDIFPELAKYAAELGYVQRGTNWDPLQFVDDVEAARGSGSEGERLLEAVQHAELKLVVINCIRQ